MVQILNTLLNIHQGRTMEIKLSDNGGICVAVLEGRLDIPGSETLRNNAKEFANKPVILDFTKLDYMASSGLRILLQLSRDAAKNGKPFAIAGRQPSVQHVFEITGCEDLCLMYPSLAEALKALSPAK